MFDWQLYNARLSRIADDDQRHDALLAARAIWERHPEYTADRVVDYALAESRRLRRKAYRITTSSEVVESAGRCDVAGLDLSGLTSRQQSIAAYLVAGYSQLEISQRLSVTDRTIRREYDAIREKMAESVSG
jgi:ATP/maltotriose-dependent transcriptional regulator MalT